MIIASSKTLYVYMVIVGYNWELEFPITTMIGILIVHDDANIFTSYLDCLQPMRPSKNCHDVAEYYWQPLRPLKNQKLTMLPRMTITTQLHPLDDFKHLRKNLKLSKQAVIHCSQYRILHWHVCCSVAKCKDAHHTELLIFLSSIKHKLVFFI